MVQGSRSPTALQKAGAKACNNTNNGIGQKLTPYKQWAAILVSYIEDGYGQKTSEF